MATAMLGNGAFSKKVVIAWGWKVLLGPEGPMEAKVGT